MNAYRLAWKEAWVRGMHTAAGIFTISLGTALLVCTLGIIESYRTRIAYEIDRMGPAAVAIPVDLDTSDYLMGADTKQVFPISTVGELSAALRDPGSRVEGRLVRRWESAGTALYVVGVTDRDALAPGSADGAVVGFRAAERLGVSPGDALRVLNHVFVVERVLPERGGSRVDLSVFASLATVQAATRNGALINEILVYCNDEASLDRLQRYAAHGLPAVKILTKKRVFEARLRTFRSLARYGIALSVLVLVISLIIVSNQMASDVEDRRREIAVLSAVGAADTAIQRLFIVKASLLGAGGGLVGTLIGEGLAHALSVRFVGLSVHPSLWVFLLSTIGVTTMVILASYAPTRAVARIAPADVLSQSPV